jgi:hypothetical protein
MNELEKIQGRQEIYSLLLDIEQKIEISWSESFFKLQALAAFCGMSLKKISLIKDYRNKEEKEGKRRTPNKILNKKIATILHNLQDQMKVDPNADILYLPGKTENGYFQNKDAKHWIIEIFINDFKLPTEFEDNLDISINYAMALCGAFYSLGCGYKNSIPVKVVLRLFEIFTDLAEKTKELEEKIRKQEETGERNSSNASTRTPARIEDYKKHDLYPDLERMIKSYQGTPKELREINKLMADILDTENRVTIRRYRHLFFQDLQK